VRLRRVRQSTSLRALGALHGLMRVRAFTQDDGHVFITEDQITSESVAITRLILDIYRVFGFEDVSIKYADRPPKRVGSDDIWDRAEAALKAASSAAGIEYTLNRGEGAFYGPKLEFVLRDAIGRTGSAAPCQVDLNMPERLGAYYIDAHSAKRTPVMLHRAISAPWSASSRSCSSTTQGNSPRGSRRYRRSCSASPTGRTNMFVALRKP